VGRGRGGKGSHLLLYAYVVLIRAIRGFGRPIRAARTPPPRRPANLFGRAGLHPSAWGIDAVSRALRACPERCRKVAISALPPPAKDLSWTAQSLMLSFTPCLWGEGRRLRLSRQSGIIRAPAGERARNDERFVDLRTTCGRRLNVPPTTLL
jgi:hypothetical protein